MINLELVVPASIEPMKTSFSLFSSSRASPCSPYLAVDAAPAFMRFSWEDIARGRSVRSMSAMVVVGCHHCRARVYICFAVSRPTSNFPPLVGRMAAERWPLGSKRAPIKLPNTAEVFVFGLVASVALKAPGGRKPLGHLHWDRSFSDIISSKRCGTLPWNYVMRGRCCGGRVCWLGDCFTSKLQICCKTRIGCCGLRWSSMLDCCASNLRCLSPQSMDVQVTALNPEHIGSGPLQHAERLEP